MQTVPQNTGTVNPKHVPGAPQQVPGSYNKSSADKDVIDIDISDNHIQEYSTNGNPHIGNLFVDKIVLTFNLSDKDHGPAIREGLLDAGNSESILHGRGLLNIRVPIGDKQSGKSTFTLHARNPAGGTQAPWRKNSPMHVTVDVSAPGRVRLCWNPANWTPPQAAEGWETLAYALCYAVCVGPQLPYVLAKAAVPRVDAALNLHGFAMNDLAWWWPKHLDRTLMLKGDRLESAYLGPFTDQVANKLVIYDKTAERLSKLPKAKQASANIPNRWLRVEARINNPNRRLECLDTITNPFRDLRCAMPHVAFANCNYPPPAGRGPHALAMATAGVPAALRSIGDTTLEKILADALDASKPALWQPQAIWAGWLAALAKAVPSVFHAPSPALH